eukprot:CAMPEP_0172484916 /NCGR_PEP_ID=MMETSP1066-20121228/12589_1 /TAXON_ID=671091 /ORGANISM="Coscinodiscus wailesii, Strain CCMP2513" /LENGTH=672 /DNA_ID=CAMNT_0013249747 /DNA_START=182 /DNA_END=2200 /DNA_ORIENTATION=+
MKNDDFKTERAGDVTNVSPLDPTFEAVTTSSSANRNLLATPNEIDAFHRRAEVKCDDMPVAKPTWMITFFIIGVLYMFLALAVVCDEFFVPSLEEMSSERHMNLTMDVAGATLMAAGGSAPELFTSIFGTFQESAIGFGTIVGSAVFNVLFVIAMCSFLSKEVLTLTWWPLARDCTYYVFGLGMLGLFVGVISAGEIMWWEALILFIMYFGYVLLMKYNRKLYKVLTGKEYVGPEDEDEEGEELPELVTDGPDVSPLIEGKPGDLSAIKKKAKSRSTYTHGRWPGTYRAGIVKLMQHPEAWRETASVGIVAQIAGDVQATFAHIDKNGDGYIDRSELKVLFEELGNPLTPEQLEEAFDELDENKDGKIMETEFTEYYIVSQGVVKAKIKEIFNKYDEDNSETIDRKELKNLLTSIEPGTSEDDIDAFMEALDSDDGDGVISFDEFFVGYKKSDIFAGKVEQVKADMGGAFDTLKPPKKGSCMQYLSYVIVLPISATLTFTIPDVRRPGLGKWCYLAFIISIVWIGVYSYLLVEWATIIGNTVGIPTVVMGLTFIAAGTSVPDLLSSVIVARRGEGDMAVSSSIGSNIFDILVGLPFPWLLFTLIKSKAVQVGADGVAISLVILLGMVVAIILSIHFSGWKLSKKLGGIMLLLYLAFLVQAIIRELPFNLCTP